MDQHSQPRSLDELLDREIAEHRKALAIARDRAAAMLRQGYVIEGALQELATLKRKLAELRPGTARADTPTPHTEGDKQ